MHTLIELSLVYAYCTHWGMGEMRLGLIIGSPLRKGAGVGLALDRSSPELRTHVNNCVLPG